jgi:hypothetical protein
VNRGGTAGIYSHVTPKQNQQRTRENDSQAFQNVPPMLTDQDCHPIPSIAGASWCGNAWNEANLLNDGAGKLCQSSTLSGHLEEERELQTLLLVILGEGVILQPELGLLRQRVIDNFLHCVRG